MAPPVGLGGRTTAFPMAALMAGLSVAALLMAATLACPIRTR